MPTAGWSEPGNYPPRRGGPTNGSKWRTAFAARRPTDEPALRDGRRPPCRLPWVAAAPSAATDRLWWPGTGGVPVPHQEPKR